MSHPEYAGGTVRKLLGCFRMIALLVPSFAPVAGNGLDMHVAAGHRFAEVTYRTTAVCETRVELTGPSGSCTLRGSDSTPRAQHRLLVPLAPGRELSLTVRLPGGERAESVRIPPAAQSPPRLELRQVGLPDGGLRMVATSDREAHWSCTVQRGGPLATSELDRDWKREVSFSPGMLGPDDRTGALSVTARWADTQRTTRIPSLLGNRLLAAEFVAAAKRMPITALAGLACAPSGSRAAFGDALEQAIRKAGLESLLEPALDRAPAVLADDRLDPATHRIPFGRLLDSLVSLDHLARARGWNGLPEVAPRPGGFGHLEYPAAAPPDSRSFYTKLLWRAIAMWNNRIPLALESATFTRLADKAEARRLTEIFSDAAKGVLGLIDRGRPFLNYSAHLPAPWLESRDGWLTLAIDVASLEPHAALHVLINDRAFLSFRNRRDTFKGYALERYKGSGGPLRPEEILANWISCRVPARLFRPGENHFVFTAESHNKIDRFVQWVLMRDLRLGP